MTTQRTQWNEATRVQMPALVHLNRLGYNYFGKISEDQANTVYDPETNILIDVFKKQFAALNPDCSGDAEQVLRTIRQELDNDDLGRSFYKRLTTVSPVRLVDFDNPQNNVYHCTAEFTCKRDQDEFRPDITLFVNGIPLVFIEVKKPNNHGGTVAESSRMNKQRFPNKKFRRFINITQLMIFSNNMEYDTMGGIVPIQGAFYCTASRDKSPFNCFREENPSGAKIAPFIKEYPYKEIDPMIEKKILTDFNCQVIHTAPEYQTNLDINTPTNRIITSMCSPDRLALIDILASTGMRVGELVLLNRDDINFEERECVVFGKGSKERIVYFDARAKIHLQNYLQSRIDNNPALFVSLKAPYNRLKIGGVEVRLRELGKRLNLSKVHPHKFRRTLATMAIDKGMPVEQLQRLLGHQRIDTTLQYAMVKQSNVKIAHRKYIG